MHLKSLKVFCDIVGRKSFSRAAAANGISQSAASQVMQQLEERLGVKLLDRSKRPFRLTPEGQVYYRGTRKLIREYYALEEKISTLREESLSVVRVASIYSVGLSHMNRYVQQFLVNHPQANVRLEYQHPQMVYELVETDQVDLGLISYPKTSRSLQVIPWRDEPMVLVCAPDSVFAMRDRIRLEELDGARMVGFDRGLAIRQAIDRALATCGAETEMAMDFDNIETIKRAIEIDAGVGILPRPTVEHEVGLGRLVAVSIEPTLTRPLAVIHRRHEELTDPMKQFIDTLQANGGARPAAGQPAPAGVRKTLAEKTSRSS